MRAKRMLVVSDFHCGHKAGLVVDKKLKHWNWFAKQIETLRPIDICLCNGDLIEGKGEKTGGTELIEADRHRQADMAIEILEYIDARQYYFTYGTPYHTGAGEDFEDQIARHFGSPIRDQLFLNIEGLHIQVKHDIRGSSVPHGRFTSLARQKLWNLFWAEFEEVPKINIFLRAHTHSFSYCGGYNWLAVIGPGLQAWGSKYGSRRVEGTVDFGFLWFDIKARGDYTWYHCIAKELDAVTVFSL